MHVGGFPGASRLFQGAPEGSRGLQGLRGPPKPSRPPKTICKPCFERKPWARLKFHAGWSGWTRPPALGGRGGLARLSVFAFGNLMGSERLEAGCRGEVWEPTNFSRWQSLTPSSNCSTPRVVRGSWFSPRGSYR